MGVRSTGYITWIKISTQWCETMHTNLRDHFQDAGTSSSENRSGQALVQHKNRIRTYEVIIHATVHCSGCVSRAVRKSGLTRCLQARHTCRNSVFRNHKSRMHVSMWPRGANANSVPDLVHSFFQELSGNRIHKAVPRYTFSASDSPTPQSTQQHVHHMGNQCCFHCTSVFLFSFSDVMVYNGVADATSTGERYCPARGTAQSNAAGGIQIAVGLPS